MTNFKKQIISAAAAGALLLNVATPALAATYQISGNGSDSKNTLDVEYKNETNVSQTNTADIKNDVEVKSDTGNNKTNENVGGDVEIKTGSADSTVNVTTTANTNAAKVDCCAVNGVDQVKISGNGDDSRNNVWLDQKNEIDVEQENYADVNNRIDVDSDTGDNEADDNVGGKVSITTGSADATVTLNTTANANMARVGSATTNGGSLSAVIKGNGDSDNEIDLEYENDIWLPQSNVADIENDVEIDGDTGDNDADDNVGGDVIIKTGSTDAEVTVDTLVNFNAADVDCGCLVEDVEAEISSNGDDSDNEIELELKGETDVEQSNFCGEGRSDCDTKVKVEGETGDNEAEGNVGGDDTDPSITTGDADTEVEVETEGNANFFGVDFDFDLEDLFDLLSN